jgi:opacity protein-like surface antigen
VRLILTGLVLLLSPALAAGQSLVVQGSAGPTMIDSGYSVAGGLGYSPTSHVTFLAQLDQSHLSSRFSTDGRGGQSAFRGGTVTLATAEVQVSLFGLDRITPYGLAGIGVGASHPNVNEFFEDRITNTVRGIFVGGGLRVPLQGRLSLFADGRVILGAEAGETLGLAPVRAGLAWRF